MQNTEISTHRLDVGSGHQLYIETSGNPDGVPVVFLHGGPGSGCESYHRGFFDAEKYRVVLFDQRGAGKSTPHAGLENNSSQDLVADLERIREYLGIEQWLVFGGSWGSTLGLLYAQAWPKRVLGLILRGIFLCRDQDVSWFYQHGASRLFPDYWKDFVAPIAKEHRDDLVTAYYELLTGDDEVARLRAAEAWSRWEGRAATLRQSKITVGHFSNPHLALSLARIECHYFINKGFIRANQILEDMPLIQDIPGIIVHGRYDCICPLDQAQALHDSWPDSQLNIIPEAGHSATEPGIHAALLRATEDFASRLT